MVNQMLERFFRYVKIDTQSQEGDTERYPSTEKQKDLARLLVSELKELGLSDAGMDDYGIVMATLPSNLPPDQAQRIPVIGLIAHLDTSPEVSGANVKPIWHKSYKGGDIILPGDPAVVVKIAENPALTNHIGNDIITSDGTTLLGADDKAGIAEIMSALDYLVHHPEIRHGKICVGFTPDEEVGAGTLHFDIKKFGADFAYTIDGENPGEVENETFNASAATYIITGINVHPGYAKDKMVNALKIAAEIVNLLDQEPSPETTEKREGYLHPYVIEGGVEKTTIKILIRDFTETGLQTRAERLEAIRNEIAQKHPRARVDLEIKESYKNMLVKLAEYPQVVEYALEAVRRAGLTPQTHMIRGGTDGAKLCFMGLLTPNIFTGGHNFHSKREWIAVQDIQKAIETIIHLLQIWVEKNL